MLKLISLLFALLLTTMVSQAQSQSFQLPIYNGQNKVVLVPIGKVAVSDIMIVKTAIENYYRATVTVSEPMDLPAGIQVNRLSKYIRTENGTRQIVQDTNNINIGELLGQLKRRKGEEFSKVIGLTTYGISTGEGNWAIRGITFNIPEDPAAFVSTHLVRQQSTTNEEYAFRLAKVALHEFGHSIGLPHCGNGALGSLNPSEYTDQKTVKKGNPACFMLESTADGEQLYRTSNQLCAACKALVKSSIR